jgi:hypothetical protein
MYGLTFSGSDYEQYGVWCRIRLVWYTVTNVSRIGQLIPDGDWNSSKFSVNIYQTARRHIPGDIMIL